MYHLLKSLKKEEESFSDLLRRLALNKNGQILDAFFGAWEMNDQEFEEIQKKLREIFISKEFDSLHEEHE
ncbi:MAG: hypothetical protein BAJALOKI1v1_1690006 [Promethearchaeota archaeon]|nr:MAG: hypothetical protein BAJALOKI1v1_1690006 [Candidatus Lokiarchaeota archaeon]